MSRLQWPVFNYLMTTAGTLCSRKLPPKPRDRNAGGDEAIRRAPGPRGALQLTRCMRAAAHFSRLLGAVSRHRRRHRSRELLLVMFFHSSCAVGRALLTSPRTSGLPRPVSIRLYLPCPSSPPSTQLSSLHRSRLTPHPTNNLTRVRRPDGAAQSARDCSFRNGFTQRSRFV